jgi:glyoxylase-like metal-dependent hydrolase (beta-lactamase superfamily II)
MVGAPDIHVEVFSAKAADVNSFIFFDSAGSLIVDATRGGADALELARRARAHGAAPKVIFITHGHPDHFLGLARLRREFPHAMILVASQQVKDDIIAFAGLMERNHWLASEPLMRARSPANPSGFDYRVEIQVLKGKTLELPGGERLEVLSAFPPTEAAHETLLFSKELHALFASDLVYNEVHLWLGRGVDSSAVENWRAELGKLKSLYGTPEFRVYPGHGATTDSGVFDVDLKYLDDFLAVAKASGTKEEARTAMIAKYPEWKGRDFILVQSIGNQFELLKK